MATRSRVRMTGALAAIVVGALSLLSAVTNDVPWRRHLLLAVEPGPLLSLGHIVAAAGGLALIYLGWATLRRRGHAIDLVIAVMLALAFVHIVKGLDYEESGLALAVAGLLWMNRRDSVRGGVRARGLIAATVAVGALAAAFAVELAFLMVAERRAAFSGAWHALEDGAWWLSSGEPVSIVLDVLMVIALTAAGVFLHALLRPAAAADGHSSPEHWHAAGIVARWGSDSLDPFALRQEKAFHFDHGGLLAYRTIRETAVVSGDPIGPPGTAGLIAASFLRFARERGWDVVFTGASGRFLASYRELGLRAMCIGQEAVVDPASFTLTGRAIRKVRQSVTRAERRGWRVEIAEGVRPGQPLSAELAAVETRWRARRKRNHGFAMTLGRLWGAPEDDTAVYALGRAPDGELRAFVRFACAGDTLSLDVMRRSGDEPNGLNEALIVRTIDWARDHGIAEVSLNFAGFAHLMASRAGLSGSQRVMRWALGRVHGRFQLERLMTFNDKFQPAWRPRYLVYGARTHLPLAALRVLQAEAYIKPPRTKPRPSCWVPAGEPSELVLAQPPEGLR